MAGVTNREFWDFRVKTRAQFTKLAEQIANIDTSGGGGISELTSKMVVDALGYTPYNANNPANYITSAALAPYALKTDIPSLVGYATEDFVNNKLGDYATKDFVNNKLINYATIGSVTAIQNTLIGQIGAVDARVEQLAATKLDSSYFTLTNIKSTLGISDWALTATKPSYTAAEVGALSLGGGTVTGEFIVNGQPIVTKAGNATIIFSPNNREQNYWFGVDIYGSLFITDNGYNKARAIIHEDNIGHYKAGDAGNSDKLGWVEASKYFKGDSTNLISNINADNLLNNACYLNATGNGSGNENFPHSYSIFNVFTNGSDSRVAQISISNDGLAIRRKIDSWGEWRHYINTANIGNYNAGSATKLQTARTLWGQSFDGSANIGGDITLNALPDGRQLSIKQSGEIKFSTPPDNEWATSLSIYANDKTTLLTSAFGAYGLREDVQYVFIGGTYDHPNIVVQDDTGYVGIGTINPEERLHVIGTIKSGNLSVSNQIDVKTIVGGSFGLYSSDTNPYLELNQNGKIAYLQMMGDNGMVALGSTASKSLVVNATGFVSINRGYVNPTEALDVGGNILASGNVKATSVTIGSITLTCDSNGALVVNGNMSATGAITAKKVG